MTKFFLILGYGIPKDILNDEHYNFYLKMAFNKIYEITIKDKIEKSIIIFCGGETDMHKPYKRNEADEMIKFFNQMIRQRPFLNSITKNWLLLSEKESLSTLENLINSKKIIDKRKFKNAGTSILCEYTREKRIKTLAKKIFGADHKLKVIPIDFDVSANRYLSPDFLVKKEKIELNHSLWALKDPKNLKKHHEVFMEKIEYLRKAGPNVHVEAVKKWWTNKLNELND